MRKALNIEISNCPECGSERINGVPGFNETKNRRTYYCMNCEREFNRKGKELAPIYA